MTYYVMDDELEMVKYLINNSYTEACGIMIPSLDDDYRLNILLDTVSKYRNCCGLQDSSELTKFSDFFWHTHSNVKDAEGKEDKGYPSPQDIFKAVKSGKKYNIVFTPWGAWSMYSNRPINEALVEKLRDNFYLIVEVNYNDKLYFKSKKGRMKITADNNVKQIAIIEEYIKYLSLYINSTYGTDFHMKFDPWYLIEKEEYFIIN
jgi:hypothetical protein